MKDIRFGNPRTDSWKLSLRGVHRREPVVELTGELRAGFFGATTPMSIPPDVLDTFATVLQSLDRTLSGSAILRNSNQQGEVSWILTALPRGHIESVGHYTINGNSLSFRFRTDQTQLGPLHRWIRAVLAKYGEADDDADPIV